ncbi:hypothetical protein ZYGR_0AZ00620 [Zygosaccharomyces rouxii]|uniref:UDP-N-acetylglucosamine transferase subunit ALG14 n=1 Tax=Zygosaccharomyces rouxii TaxID=4956 RepID=A0A1Q3AJI2_ZYGRO|nr:hypothetical protein ZYGR_0AZ00620 [Zygosaccharomyces rouxii]
MNASVVAGIALLFYTFYVYRLIRSLPWLSLQRASGTGSIRECSPLNIFVFLGSGGHTGEMLRILENYESILLNNGCTIHVGYSDDASRHKFESFVKSSIANGDSTPTVKYYEFDKAREVNSSVFRSLLTVVSTLYTSLLHVLTIRRALRNQAHLILLNGPGTCCVLALWFKVWEILDFTTNDPSNIVYVESLARINTLSLTGKILYYMSDMFVVQWPQLLEKYPRAKSFGILT